MSLMRKTFRPCWCNPSLALLCLLCVLGGMAQAAPKLRVVALFPDKAMVEIDGRQQVLHAGQPTKEGILLISADFEEAVIEVDGQRQSHRLDNQIGGQYTSPAVAELRIPRDSMGAYAVSGSINGRRVSMIVDTGATAVAMSETEAQRLKLRYDRNKPTGMVQTASGVTPAYAVKLDKVEVGPLALYGVEGVVVQGAHPPMVLLGMTFLSRIEMSNEGGVLLLRGKQ
jgi:aspartyl protease family protein